MSRIAYVNGRYVNHADAQVHIEDRGYQFADGVYEVCEIRDGHLHRRDAASRSARAIAARALDAHADVARRAEAGAARGGAAQPRARRARSTCRSRAAWRRRDHAFPANGTPPALVVTAKSISRAKGDRVAHEGVSVITRARQSLGARRHQDGRAAAQCHGAGEGQAEGRARGMVRRPQRLRHRRGRHHRLDRDARRSPGHAAERHRHPARRDAHDRHRRRPPRRHEGRGAEVHGCGGKRGARGVHDRRLPRFWYRSCRSTATRSPTGGPGPVSASLRAVFHDVAEKLP